FDAGLEAALTTERFQHAKQMLMGRAEPRPDIPCTTCDLYKTMQSDGRWISREEIPLPASAILLSVFVDPGASEATHADIFLYPGHKPNRIALAEPPPSVRFEIGKGFSALMNVSGPGDYTLCALPKRIDPEYRKYYPPLEPVTKSVTITARPTAQELSIQLCEAPGFRPLTA